MNLNTWLSWQDAWGPRYASMEGLSQRRWSAGPSGSHAAGVQV